ncbi:pyridoxamine 5'-phosphate oxidase family protein, partial [Streptomyces eurythermus]
MTPPPARSVEQCTKDVLHRLEDDVDAWVATAAPDGAAPHLVPLPFVWDGTSLLIATAADSPTGRDLVATGRARLGVGSARDVVRDAVLDQRGLVRAHRRMTGGL